MFVPILAYHKVQKTKDLGVTYITPEQFEKQINYLYHSGYRTISIADLLQGKGVNSKSVVISFDDAYSCVYDFAFPILTKYHFTATLFVITKFVGMTNSWDYHLKRFQFRHCTWEEIKNLDRAGWEIGSHTVTHPNLNNLSPNKLWHEVVYSKHILETILKKSVNVFSYPFGKFNKRVIRYVQQAGYLGACTLGTGFVSGQQFPYVLHRRGVYLLEPMLLFKIKLQNNYWSRFDDLKQRMITFCSQGSILVRYLKSH